MTHADPVRAVERGELVGSDEHGEGRGTGSAERLRVAGRSWILAQGRDAHKRVIGEASHGRSESSAKRVIGEGYRARAALVVSRVALFAAARLRPSEKLTPPCSSRDVRIHHSRTIRTALPPARRLATGSETWRVGQLVRTTGLTVRAPHHCDASEVSGQRRLALQSGDVHVPARGSRAVSANAARPRAGDVRIRRTFVPGARYFVWRLTFRPKC